MGGVARAVKKVAKASVKFANPVTATKMAIKDPIGGATLGLYAPIAKQQEEAKAEQQRIRDQYAEQDAEQERRDEQTRRQSEARQDEQQGDGGADSTAVLLSTQNMLQTSPTLLSTAQADSDEEVKRRLSRGNRLNGG